jgi:predicted nucleic acid-binding protein
VIYLDSSALLKLVHDELESAALAAWLEERTEVPVVSSELAVVEVVRASRRVDRGAVPRARSLMAGVDLIPFGTVIDQACDVGGTALRSLDAIHLASALAIVDDLTAFVAYDRRLTVAAQAAGLGPLAPS